MIAWVVKDNSDEGIKTTEAMYYVCMQAHIIYIYCVVHQDHIFLKQLNTTLDCIYFANVIELAREYYKNVMFSSSLWR